MFEKIAVLGAGHGGCTMAADLSMAGYQVNLYEHPDVAQNLEPIQEKGGIDIIAQTPAGVDFQLPAGGKTGFAKITGKITSDMQEAIKDVELIMLVVPGFAREKFIQELGKYLEDGQTIVVWPGYFGAVRCAKLLADMGVKKDVTICETESLIYATKKTGPAQVLTKGKKDRLLCAAFPATRTQETVKRLQGIFSALVPAKNVLETTIANLNPILHPPSVVCNLYRVERKFYPYFEDIGGPFIRSYDVTPGMAGVMESVDNERIAIAEKLGLKVLSLKETLHAFYHAVGKDLYETVLNCSPYQKQAAPTSLNHRYVTEDIPFGLVPFASLADQLQIPAPTIKGVVALACAETRQNYWETGLTVEKLGLAGKSVQEIVNWVTNGD